MSSLWTLNINYPPLVHRQVLPWPKIHRPDECFTATDEPGTYASTLNASNVRGEDDSPTDEAFEAVNTLLIESLIDHIRSMLNTFGEGRINVSPYDTAFVALIKDVEGRNFPQFPSSLEWIAQHQLPDGSWGDEQIFCPYDRLLNTLACVLALTTWNTHVDKTQKGISYIKKNVYQLEKANADHMPCGFEVVFPTLIKRAQELGIHDIPYDAPVIIEIRNVGRKKLERIPVELMHKVPTTLLFSLEGLEDHLDWERLVKLKSIHGFLTSPSSTAFAFMETKDEDCFKFINNIVQKYNGGVPHAYPNDLFARLWAVDRLQRLGISHFFESEIRDCLTHVYRVWTDKGIFSATGIVLGDIDNTAMGFMLLRLQGYHVDPNVFRNFKSNDKFFCCRGEMNESPTTMYNLYRASQVQFPGEKILEEAHNFAKEFLHEKLSATCSSIQLLDKWVITEHLYDEVKCGLEMPWYASLLRIVARFYLQHYAGANEAWIGKTLYRIEEISNNSYKELAILDFKRCQAQHQTEWSYMQEWYKNHNVDKSGISRKEVLLAYFLAASSIFEPERAKERITWAKSQIISQMITSFLNKETTAMEQKAALITVFTNNIINALDDETERSKTEHALVKIIVGVLNQLFDGFNRCISKQLKKAWVAWLVNVQQGQANSWEDAELLVTTLNICAGRITFNEGLLSHLQDYKTLCKLTNKICYQLALIRKKKDLGVEDWSTTRSRIKTTEIEQDMQALVKIVLEDSGGIDRNIKQTFLSVVKTFYYSAYNDADTIDTHIFKVLFESIV